VWSVTTSVVASLLELSRIGNALVAALAAWIGGDVGAPTFEPGPAAIGALVALFVAAWGNTVNDIYDRDVDALYKSARPLSSGRVTVAAAWIWAGVMAVAAVSLSLSLPSDARVLVLITLLLLWLYSYRLKGWLGLGHVVVAGLAGLSFVFGALVQGATWQGIMPQGWVAFGFAFIWHLAREWLKAAEDVEEDRESGLKTMAVIAGPERTSRAAAVLLAVLISLITVPWFQGWFNLTYLILVCVGVLPVLIGSIVYLWWAPDRDRLGQISRILKWDMLAGICAIWFGQS